MQQHFDNLMMEINKCSVIVFSNRALEEIKKETLRKTPDETGGILLGKIIDDQWYVIATTEPGPNSIFQISYFEYDQEFVTKEANRISKEYEHELELLGLWHRHPGSMDTFSSTDDGTNIEFAKLNMKGAISGLVNLDPDFRLTMYHVDSPLNYNQIEVFVDDDLVPPDLLVLKSIKKEQKSLKVLDNNKNTEFNEEPIDLNLTENEVIQKKRSSKKFLNYLKIHLDKNPLLFLIVSTFVVIIIGLFISLMNPYIDHRIGIPIKHYVWTVEIMLCLVILVHFLAKLMSDKRKPVGKGKNYPFFEADKVFMNFNKPEFRYDINEKDGRPFFYGKVISKSNIAYPIKIVYENNYNGKCAILHTYFIEPYFLKSSELINHSNKKLPFLYKDSGDQFYLNFKTKKSRNTAINNLQLTEKWINNFESLRNKDITVEEFRNTKIN